MSNGFWSLVAVLSFWGWVGAVAAFILTVFPAGGMFRSAPAVRWGSVVLLLFAIWLLGLARS